MQRMIFLIALTMMTSPLFAQNVTTSNKPLSPSNVPETVSCWESKTAPEIYTQVIENSSNYKITFCIPNTTVVDAINYQNTLKVDGSQSFTFAVSCNQFNNNAVCYASIPIDLNTILNSDGSHLVTLTSNGTSLQFIVRAPVCIDNGITYKSGTPLPASVTGALRNQQGSFTFESQVGKLRSEGFRIEWQRVQFSLDSTGLNGYWFMLGWCEGK